MNPEMPDNPRMEDPHAQIEMAFIAEYLRSQGYSYEMLHELPEDEATRLMKEASLYASTKLMEMEARAHFVEEIHSTSKPGG
jgi:hypothetical protein